MAGKMRIRATAKDGTTVVKVLMAHPMETGLRKGPDGKLVPAHHITDVTASLNGEPVLQAYWGGAVAQNPFIEFEINGGAAGDKLVVSWKDNLDESQSEEVTIR